MAFGTVAKWVWAIGGSFPHNPQIVGDRPSWDRLGQNELVCNRARHRNPIISVGLYIPHGESQKNISVGMYITQSIQGIHFRSYVHPTQSIQENISVHMYIPHSFMCRLVCERCNYHTRSSLVNCLLLSTISHTIWWRKLCGIGYPPQALLLLEPFAKVWDTFSRFISL